MKAINLIKKYKLELFLIVYQMIFLFVNNYSFVVKDSVILCYINDFSTGFGPRKLVATLTSFLFGDYVSYNEIRLMVLFVSFALMVLFSFFIGSTMRRIESEHKYTFLYLVILYLSCSFAVTFLFQWATFGRMEAWHILILIAYLLLSRKSNDYIRPLWMFVACELSMIIHHMFLSTFLPVYLFLAIYELRKANFDKRLLIKYFFVFTCVAASFLLLHFIKFDEMPYDQTLNYLNNKTNAEVSEYFVRWIYFEPISKHLDQFVKPYLIYNIGSVIISLILFAPLYYVIYKGIKKAVICSRKSSNGRTISLYFLACAPMLIAYITASDFGRWSASHFTGFFLFFVYLLSENNHTAKDMLASFGNHIKAHKFFYMLLPLYLILFSKNMCKFPDEFKRFLDIVLSALRHISL